MLLRMLRSIFGGVNPAAPPATAIGERVLALKRQIREHARAPTDAHVAILFRDVAVAGVPVTRLVGEALRDTNTTVPPAKAIHRPAASLFLTQYFLHALTLPGRRAECGVFNGTSALMLCRAARAQDASFDGAGMHLVDSFEGLSAPGAEDDIDGFTEAQKPPFVRRGSFAAQVEQVRGVFAEFPGVAIHKGWLPAVLAELPDAEWSFVHIDVDLHAPTLAVLEYFAPRLVRGGVIVCDDYGAPLFPGASRAWDEYCGEHNVPFVVLPTGQSVILKT
jgi:Macrocin-O-methyltransferase (TylF)